MFEPMISRARGRAATLVRLAVATATAAGAILTASPAPAGAAPSQPAGPVPAFVYRDGEIETFDSPSPDVSLFPTGINDQGEIVGEYMGPDGESGFHRAPDGTITAFKVPGAAGTEAVKINDLGEIVGRYSEDTPLVDDSDAVRGFIRRGDNITRLNVPDARSTSPTAINDQGHVVGTYVDAEGTTHGFVWRDGAFTTIDLRGASSPTPVDINDQGDIVGLYVDAGGATLGFILTEDEYWILMVNGAASTVPTGINDSGQISVYVADDGSLSGARGVVMDGPADATGTPIEIPGASGSVALGINDQGHVVGLQGVAAETTGASSAAGMGMAAESGLAEMPAGPARTAGTVMGTDVQVTEVRGITVNVAIAEQVDAMLAAAAADGIDLSGGGYRSTERQIELRASHCGPTEYDIYQKPSSQCSPPTARPGMSMHERGLAIDFDCDGSLITSRSSECYLWLAENAAGYGLYNLPSEAWHWSTSGS